MILDTTDGGQETKEKVTIERLEKEGTIYNLGRIDLQRRSNGRDMEGAIGEKE
jgi:hypothetical protein